MSPFTVKSWDKNRCITEANRIMAEFEPNSNYELELHIRRCADPRGRSKGKDWGWALTTRLVFPHMSYKHKVVQRDLWGKTRAGVDLSPRRQYNRHIIHRGFSTMLRPGQATLSLLGDGNATPSLPIYKQDEKVRV